METWLLVVAVAVIGALAYFVIGDWFNPYIKASNPLKRGN